MTDHPITPSRELVLQWIKECDRPFDTSWPEYEQEIANRAAQWVYDQRSKVNEAELQQARDEELEACCVWLDRIAYRQSLHIRGSHLRAARRPKPPNLKEQALEDLGILVADLANLGMEFKTTNIFRALEALPND